MACLNAIFRMHSLGGLKSALHHSSRGSIQPLLKTVEPVYWASPLQADTCAPPGLLATPKRRKTRPTTTCLPLGSHLTGWAVACLNDFTLTRCSIHQANHSTLVQTHHMGVDLRGLEGSVFQDHLDIPQVGTLALELRGKGVPKRMTSDTLLDNRSTRIRPDWEKSTSFTRSRTASMILSPLPYINYTISLWTPVSFCITAVASACDSTVGNFRGPTGLAKIQLANVQPQKFAKKQDQGIQSCFLNTDGDMLFNSQVSQKRLDVLGVHLML